MPRPRKALDKAPVAPANLAVTTTPGERKDSPGFQGFDSCLISNGEPNPLKTWTNIERHEYTCPRLCFVMRPYAPALSELAAEWGVSHKMLREWAVSQRWVSQRKRYWDNISTMAGEDQAKSLSQIHNQELGERYGIWKTLRKSIVADFERGYTEQQSATGKINNILLSPSDKKALAQTLVIIEGGINETVGLSETLSRMNKKGSSMVDDLSANGIILNLTAEPGSNVQVQQANINSVGPAKATPELESGEDDPDTDTITD